MMENHHSNEQAKGLAFVQAIYAIVMREARRGTTSINPNVIIAEAMREAGIE